jgi:DHA1 family multidrug resistance protein-like MFS transporter
MAVQRACGEPALPATVPAGAPDRAAGAPHQAAPGVPWRRTFITICISQAIAMLAFSMAIPFLPLYVQRLGVTDPAAVARWAGAMSSGAAIVLALMAPVWGAIADRWGRKPMVVRAMIGGGGIVALMGLARTPEQLLALRTFQGAFAGTITASRTLLATVVPVAELGFALGVMQTAGFIGNSLGPLVGGLVADQIGYGPTFAFTGAILVLAGFAVVRLVHEDFVPPPPDRDRSQSWLSALRVATQVPGMLALIATLFFVQAAVGVMAPVLPLFVQSLVPEGQGSVASLTGVILGAAAISSALAAGIAGRVGDRIGHRRVLAVCAVGGGLLYLPQAFVTAPWQLLTCASASACSPAGFFPA